MVTTHQKDWITGNHTTVGLDPWKPHNIRTRSLREPHSSRTWSQGTTQHSVVGLVHREPHNSRTGSSKITKQYEG